MIDWTGTVLEILKQVAKINEMIVQVLLTLSKPTITSYTENESK